jgi:dienelactone hydrolase
MGEHLEHEAAGANCEHYVAKGAGSGRRPCVLVLHQWAGVSDIERQTADRMAEKGWVGFAVDVYGKGVRGDLTADNSALMGPFLQDRALLRDRLLGALEAARNHPSVDPDRIAVVGYCFGGLAALDMARAGAPVLGVVSIHGIFAPPNLGPQAPITAKVLVLHGWNDDLAPPDAFVGMANEMTEAGADWHAVAYGHAQHAFTGGPNYNEPAARRSQAATLTFLDEVFG